MIVFLENRVLIKISGPDSFNFLQSQFTNDINKIDDQQLQMNAYCQHQGKIISLIWIFKKENNYFLSLPSELKDLVLSRLQMFKLMSEIEITDSSSQINQYGLINTRYDGCLKIINNLSLYTTSNTLEVNCDLDVWEKECIENKLPEIYLNNSEKHIPQSLNLDINELGVSFTKGCYPGQEVVARMHYLGKPKRRLFKFSSEFSPSIGDLINIKDSKSLKSSGMVLRVTKNDECYHLLGTFEIEHTDKPIFLNNDTNKTLTINE